jgi:hypothetical protein
MSTSQSSENNYQTISEQQNTYTPFIGENSISSNPTNEDNGLKNQISQYNNQYNENNNESHNIVIQPIPQFQPNNIIYNPFPNIKSIDQINHYGVFEIEKNKYKVISGGCCFKFVFPMIFIIVGLGVMAMGPFTTYALLLFGLIFFLAGLGACYCLNKTFLFILGENNLEVVIETIFGKKSTIYNPGDINKIDFYSTLTYDSESGRMNNYNLILQTNNGPVVLINFSTNINVFTNDEMDYLSYVINNHINTKMRV